MIEARLTWHEIKALPADLPDAELEILVYDADLDDTVPAVLDWDGERMMWADVATGQELPHPRYWAEKPYPDDETSYPVVRIGRYALRATVEGNGVTIRHEDGHCDELPVGVIEAALDAYYRQAKLC